MPANFLRLVYYPFVDPLGFVETVRELRAYGDPQPTPEQVLRDDKNALECTLGSIRRAEDPDALTYPETRYPEARVNQSTWNTLNELDAYIKQTYPLAASDESARALHKAVHEAFKRYSAAVRRPNPVFVYVRDCAGRGFCPEEIKILVAGIALRVVDTSAVLEMQDALLRAFGFNDAQTIAPNAATETGGSGGFSHIQLFYDFAADMAKAFKLPAGAVQFHPLTIERLKQCIRYRKDHGDLPSNRATLDAWLTQKGELRSDVLNAAFQEESPARQKTRGNAPSETYADLVARAQKPPAYEQQQVLDGWRERVGQAQHNTPMARIMRLFPSKKQPIVTPNQLIAETPNVPHPLVRKGLQVKAFFAGRELAEALPPELLNYSEQSLLNQAALTASGEDMIAKLLKSTLSTLTREGNADDYSHIAAAGILGEGWLPDNLWAEIHVGDKGVETNHANSCRRMFMGILKAAKTQAAGNPEAERRLAHALIGALNHEVDTGYCKLQRDHMWLIVEAMKEARIKALEEQAKTGTRQMVFDRLSVPGGRTARRGLALQYFVADSTETGRDL